MSIGKRTDAKRTTTAKPKAAKTTTWSDGTQTYVSPKKRAADMAEIRAGMAKDAQRQRDKSGRR